MSSNNKLVIGFVVGTLAIIVGGVFLVSKTGNSAQLEVTQEAKAEIAETTHDWGEININDGNVTKVFKIKNTGSGALKLANVITSCMCTTAQVQINDKKSPSFGMHSKSSWLGEVAPGSEANVLIEFDPLFHGPNGVGAISRQISLETNDPKKLKITFNVLGNVIRGK